jgi:hypothetical protein
MDMQAPALSHHLARKQRILLMVLGVVGGAVIILVMAMVFFSKENLEPLVTKVVAQQQELLRVNELADKFSPDLAIRQTQATVASIVASDLQEMMNARSELVKTKITKETSSLYSDAQAQERFQDAAQRNALDGEYRDTLRDHLEGIEASVRDLSSKSQSDQLKATLKGISNHNAFLLEHL